MTKDEALKLAMECLDGVWRGDYSGNAKEVITAIKEALANEALEKMAENARELGLDYEPEQEPVAWRAKNFYENQEGWFYAEWHQDGLTPQVAELLYATPPQRTWVGLTDGEVDKMILLMGFPPDWITENAIVKNIVRNLEAKLKEKNS